MNGKEEKRKTLPFSVVFTVSNSCYVEYEFEFEYYKVTEHGQHFSYLLRVNGQCSCHFLISPLAVDNY